MRPANRRNTVDTVLRPLRPFPGQVQEVDNQNLRIVAPCRKKTQQDQDTEDDEERKKAMKDLVQSWMDRLQLISLITTFLASVEAGMLQVTSPEPGDHSSRILNASNASLLSALILHLHSSFVSFFAAFFLIRFKVKEAIRVEAKVDPAAKTKPTSKGSILLDMAAQHVTGSPATRTPSSSLNSQAPEAPERQARQDSSPPIWSANPQLVQVGFFQRQPPMYLLSRCHTLCVLTATVGFVLALIGVACFAWASQPISVSISTTVFVGLCVLSGIVILMMRNDESHRFFIND